MSNRRSPIPSLHRRWRGRGAVAERPRGQGYRLVQVGQAPVVPLSRIGTGSGMILVPQRGIIRDRRGVVLAEYARVRCRGPCGPPAEPWSGRDDVLAVVSPRTGHWAGNPDLQANVPADGGMGSWRAIFRTRSPRGSRSPRVTRRSRSVWGRNGDIKICRYSQSFAYFGICRPPVDQATLDSGDYQRTDVVGRAGLEATYEALLRGVPGYRDDEVDALQRRTRGPEPNRRPWTAGMSS